MEHRYDSRTRELFQLVDPYAYRDRFTMPKCIINASGDQFFVPDSSQFYYDDLPGEKNLCYVPNAGHSLKGSNALDTLVAFHHCILNDIPRPEFKWEFPDAATIRVETKSQPKRVLLWQAHNEKLAIFGLMWWDAPTEHGLESIGGRFFTGKVEKPAKGWKAFFIQLEFDVTASQPMRLSTPVPRNPGYASVHGQKRQSP